MTVFNHGLTLATLFLLLNTLFLSGTWAKAFPAAGSTTKLSNSGLSWPGKLQSNRLAKRASAYYNTCYTKGNTLKCATEWTDATAEERFERSVVATYTTRAQLEEDGWTIDADPYTELEKNMVKYVGQDMLDELGITTSNNVVVNWVHTEAVDDTHPATNANFQCWYNTADGAIFVDLAWSPSYKKSEMENEWDDDDELPDIKQLSDVMWIEWAARASDPGSIKYIFQMNVVNLNTRAIIEEAIAIDAAEDAEADTVYYWEFDMTSETGQALLGTPNGNPQAWFLINHKTALGADQTADPVTGLKTLSKVRIWTNQEQCYIPELDVEDSDGDVEMDVDEAGMAPCYHMFFYVTDV
ncbi:hypothetical protein BDW59DRAFT_159893 [Aspergillus cavernicola]|uniref:Concanavalin A-like lectin/glucanase domain-containing protein n=1 Tax=Aspergillus cavernicola TaxID=176166 RepID=A0ABR4IJG7_9EURO